MIHNLIMHVICPFVGTVAFAVLFNVPRRFYLCCGCTGVAGWLMYRITGSYGASAATASFCGTLVVVLLSRILTVIMKCPITIFLVSGIIPLVPGAGIYYTVFYLVNNELQEAGRRGMESAKVAFAIVLAIVFVVSLPSKYFQPVYWTQRKIRKG